MTGPKSTPDKWPIDREVRYLEEKLGPFEDYNEWSQKQNTNMKERLGEDGHQLMHRLQSLETFLADYDMTPEEAIDCLEYEIEQYRDH